MRQNYAKRRLIRSDPHRLWLTRGKHTVRQEHPFPPRVNRKIWLTTVSFFSVALLLSYLILYLAFWPYLWVNSAVPSTDSRFYRIIVLIGCGNVVCLLHGW